MDIEKLDLEVAEIAQKTKHAAGKDELTNAKSASKAPQPAAPTGNLVTARGPGPSQNQPVVT